MEQRLNGEYLRPGLIDRAAAVALGAIGLGAGILLATWGLSFLWRYTPPEIAVRIANPEVRLEQGEPLKVAVVQTEPFKVDPATITVKADRLVAPSQAPTHTRSGDVIKQEVTVFSSVEHTRGHVVTGWKFRDGSGGTPFSEYCYYGTPAAEGASVRLNIANDGVRDAGVSVSRVPDFEAALAKCVWFNGRS